MDEDFDGGIVPFLTKIETLEFKCIKIAKNISDLNIKQKALPEEISAIRLSIVLLRENLPKDEKELSLVKKRIKRGMKQYKKSKLRLEFGKITEVFNDVKESDVQKYKLFDTINQEADHLLNLKRWIRKDMRREKELLERVTSFPRAEKELKQALERALSASASIDSSIAKEKKKLKDLRGYLKQLMMELKIEDVRDDLYRMEKQIAKEKKEEKSFYDRMQEEMHPAVKRLLSKCNITYRKKDYGGI